MERYTEKHYDGNGYYLICSGNCETLNCGDCGILDKIVDRLAAYEDTSLEPEEIISAIDMAKIACALHELNAYKELGSIDCLRKLAGGPGETSTITNGGKIRAMDDVDWRKRFCAAGGQKWRRESLRIFPLGGVT